MSLGTDLTFGTLNPAGMARVAIGCMNALSDPYLPTYLPGGALGVNLHPDTVAAQEKYAVEKEARDRSQIALVAGVGTAVVALIALRFAAAWYVGKQFDQGASGAIIGGIFGVPGLGVLALVTKD